MSISKKASVIIVTYNHEKYIESCLTSVLKNRPLEVIVVDNSSTDRTTEIVKKFKKVKLIKNKINVGYGNGNNLGVKHAKGKYIVILNPDTRVDKKWLKELLKPLENRKKLITTPKILNYDGSKINTCGIVAHFTGLAFTRGLDEPPKKFQKFEHVSGFSGACFAMRKEDFLNLGGFDKNFLIYMEDVELSWRAHANKFKILYVPTSIVYHDYKLKVPPEKIYHLEKGRYIILRKYLSYKTLLLLLPSLLLTEILTWGYSILKGIDGVKFKIMGLIDGTTARIKKIKCDQKSILKRLEWRMPTEQLSYGAIDRFIKNVANRVYQINYKMVLWLS